MKKMMILGLILTVLLLVTISVSCAENEYIGARYSHTSVISADITWYP